MPTMNNYMNFIYVNLGFLALTLSMVYFRKALDIKENWPKYRCNPSYWIFSDNITQDFNYCVQNTQMNMMGYLLQPMNQMVSNLTSMGAGFNESINGVRNMFSSIRGFITDIVQNIFGVFLNLVIEIQKMTISIKDLVGKMLGIVVTILYVLDGSIKTMNSAWGGPPGQMVRAIGSCFKLDTLVTTKYGKQVAMSELPAGVELADGSKAFAVMKIANLDQVPYYKMVGETGQEIFVTGDHYVQNKDVFVKVKDHPAAIKTDIVDDTLACLITTNARIKLDGIVFWDWEDDELTFRQHCVM